ncbi:MAG: 50S ribosomal protein L4 [bacterium]
MAELKKIKTISGVDGIPINYFHITESYLRQTVNSFRFTSKVKTKAEVDATGSKWFRQKGTGRARQGEMTNPHMSGGGKAHPPRPRYRPIKLNKRVRRSAWLSALGWHLSRGTAFVVEAAEVAGMLKTKQVAEMLDSAGLYGRLIICCSESSPLNRSARNLANVALLSPSRLNVRDMMLAESIVFVNDALAETERRAAAMIDGVKTSRGALNLSLSDFEDAISKEGGEDE